MIVDLHLDDSSDNFDAKTAFSTQMEIFEKALDTAIYQNAFDLRVIHGIGSGKLKNAIHNYLKDFQSVQSYSCEWHPSYGMGSTLIIFKL